MAVATDAMASSIATALAVATPGSLPVTLQPPGVSSTEAISALLDRHIQPVEEPRAPPDTATASSAVVPTATSTLRRGHRYFDRVDIRIRVGAGRGIAA